MKKVIVITGIGGMGLAIARRIGSGYKLILADFAKDKLALVSKELTDSGYDVTTEVLDVSNQESVANLAARASESGEIHAIIHTAGLSPNMSDPNRILDVNLIGTARIIEAFEPYLSYGTVGVMISSMAAYSVSQLDPKLEKNLGLLAAGELKSYIVSLGITDPGYAYSLSKKGNHLQVFAAALKWGKKGARIISVSPGIISTPMGLSEREKNPGMDTMLENSPIPRIGTPEDIASLVDFLQGPNASYITGIDVLIDGGVTALTKALGEK